MRAGLWAALRFRVYDLGPLALAFGRERAGVYCVEECLLLLVWLLLGHVESARRGCAQVSDDGLGRCLQHVSESLDERAWHGRRADSVRLQPLQKRAGQTDGLGEPRRRVARLNPQLRQTLYSSRRWLRS